PAARSSCGSNACGCCAWSNATERATCLSNYRASISAGAPKGDAGLLPWTSIGQQGDPASWLCYDPGERCDGVDNNGAGGTDEGITKCGSPPHCPTTETCNGQDDDCDGIVDNAPGNGSPYSLPNCVVCVPSPEICDGCDNDCDGVADDGV